MIWLFDGLCLSRDLILWHAATRAKWNCWWKEGRKPWEVPVTSHFIANCAFLTNAKKSRVYSIYRIPYCARTDVPVSSKSKHFSDPATLQKRTLHKIQWSNSMHSGYFVHILDACSHTSIYEHRHRRLYLYYGIVLSRWIGCSFDPRMIFSRKFAF